MITPIEIWRVVDGQFETVQIVSPEDIPEE